VLLVTSYVSDEEGLIERDVKLVVAFVDDGTFDKLVVSLAVKARAAELVDSSVEVNEELISFEEVPFSFVKAVRVAAPIITIMMTTRIRCLYVRDTAQVEVNLTNFSTVAALAD